MHQNCVSEHHQEKRESMAGIDLAGKHPTRATLKRPRVEGFSLGFWQGTSPSEELVYKAAADQLPPISGTSRRQQRTQTRALSFPPFVRPQTDKSVSTRHGTAQPRALCGCGTHPTRRQTKAAQHNRPYQSCPDSHSQHKDLQLPTHLTPCHVITM